MISRRLILGGLAAGAAAPAWARVRRKVPAAPLPNLAAGAQAILASEMAARVAKVQGLMQAKGIGGFVVEAGSSLRYFTGIQWWTSERVTAALIPAEGQVIIVTPAFEEPSVRETLAIDAEVRPWNEDENPEAKLVQAMDDHRLKGSIAVEPTTRFFIVDGLLMTGSGRQVVSGQDLINACRQIKSPAELSLMQTATDITLAALRHVHAEVRTGMTSSDIADLMDAATTAMGGAVEFSLVLLNEASAYPHGSHQKQQVHEGSVILMDCGCAVYGYQSDMSRSWVHGGASPRQRQVWETVRKGQDIALAAARIGVPVGAIDDAVRTFYESEGWGPGYRLPGLSHRTGHGIGLDGHESPYLVHGDATPLEAGMCFSDEPGLYIPGEFGIRLEDCWHMTEDGPKTFSPLAESFDKPV